MRSDEDCDDYAFPSGSETHSSGRRGMTLRDWFAGQAAAGMLLAVHHEQHGENAKSVAETAYRIADAMLVARSRNDAD
jgi:hypothetical protein